MSCSNTVCLSTGVCNALSALVTRRVRILWESSGLWVGSPSGYGIPTAGIILLAPIVSEIGTIVAMCTIGSPCFSIPFSIVAPQRVQVPHVLTRMTPSTLCSTSISPIASPNLAAEPVAVPVPVVA